MAVRPQTAGDSDSPCSLCYMHKEKKKERFRKHRTEIWFPALPATGPTVLFFLVVCVTSVYIPCVSIFLGFSCKGQKASLN